MKKIYRKMMVLMNRKQKLKMVQILFMMVIGAFLETVSIGLVVPAIQMIMDPSCVEGDSALAQIYRWTGFQKPGYFTTLILALIILGFVLKNVFLYFQIPQYIEAVNKLGKLEQDECFGYVPLLGLGGSEKVQNLKKVKIREHIELISQLVGKIGMIIYD